MRSFLPRLRRLQVEVLEQRRLLSVVGDLVWHDLDGDGVQDGGEPGIEGAVVELFSSTDAVVGNGDDVSVGVDITDANGQYSIAGLVPATNYYLQFRTPVGDPTFVFAPQDVGGDDTIDSDADAVGNTAMFTVTGDDFGLDAGLVNGPAPDFGFALVAGGTNRQEGRSVATDADGNVYVAGYFRATVDFDHGPGTYNLTSAGQQDIFVAKYSSTGALVWARGMGGASKDYGYGIAVGTDGSVYTTGSFQGAADFDPGGGTYNLTSAGGEDIFVSKLDSAGNFVWACRMGAAGGGVADDVGYGIDIGTDGSVHTTGFFTDTADFDPGPGTYNLTSAGGEDIFVSKLDASGNFVWACRMGAAGGGGADDAGYGIAVGTDGSVHTTGFFTDTADFDPGAGTYNLTSAGGDDVFVSKLDASGNFVWARRMGSAGGGGADDVGYGIALGADGSVHTTGFFTGTADFDTGAGTYNLTSAGGDDVFVSKLNSGGNFTWAAGMGGANNDIGYGIAVATDGTVHTAGSFEATADFDPGAGTFNLTSAGGDDIFVSKLDSAGSLRWACNMGGIDNDVARGIAVANYGQDTAVYTTGSFRTTADFDPGPGTFNLTSVGNTDAFLSKLWSNRTLIGDLVWHDLDSDGIQDAGEPGIEGAAVELFSSTDGIVGNADDVSLGVDITDAGGQYWFNCLTSATNYYLQFRVPVGDPAYVFTAQDVGGDDTIDSDADASGATAMFTLAGNDLTLDAGFVNGPAPSFGFALRAGGAGYEEAWGVATDADGNAYIVGSFEGTPDFDHGPGTYNLTSTGSVDAFVAKYSMTGALVWARRMGGTDWDDGYGITLDDAGNVYMTGCFRGAAADFGTDILASTGAEDIFVAKLDGSDGDFIWARKMGGTGWDDGYAITVAGDGSVYSTGYFSGTADFDPGPGTYNLDSAGAGDVYISRLDGDGNFLGAQRMGGTDWNIGYGITVDDTGNVHVAGYFCGTADFDPGPGIANLTSVSGSIGDIFVAKLDDAGNFLWARRMGGTGWDYACGIALAADGSVYTSGYFYETADFGTTNLISVGDADIFACKLDASGNFLWARRMGGAGYDAGFGMAVAGDGTIYTTGYFSGTVDFDPGAGTQNLTSAGYGDVFLSQLDSDGNFASAGQMGGAGDDCGYGVAASENGCIYTVGSFYDTSDFDPGAGTFNLTSAGGSDIFLSDPPWQEEDDPPPEPADGSDNAGQEDAPPVVFGTAGGGTSDPEIAGGSDVLESDPPWQEEDDPPPEPADGSDNAGQDDAPAVVSGGNDVPGNREAPLFESAVTAGPDASAVEGRGYGADYQTYYFERLGTDKRGNDQSDLFDFDHLPSLEAASNRSSNAPLDLLYETLAFDQVGDTADRDAEEAVPFLGLVLQTVGNWQGV